MEKVLVTGATGFIGQHLIDYLCQLPVQVRVLIRDTTKVKCLPSSVEVFMGDFTQPESLKNIGKGIDTVFHVGGYAHASKQNSKRVMQKHQENNYLGTKNIFQAIESENVQRFVYFSSVKAVADSTHCINEAWDLPANTAYGRAKKAAEEFVLTAGKQAHIHVSVLRPPLVYGTGCKGNLLTMLKAIDHRLFLPIPETHNRLSLISVQDLCAAAILVANHSAADQQIYFVTDGNIYSIHQLYVLIYQALREKIPTWYLPMSIFKTLAKLGDVAGKITQLTMPFNTEKLDKLFGSAEYNADKITQDLGFKPTYDFASLLPQIISAYKNGLCQGKSA